VATGAAGAGYAKRKVKKTAAQLAPANVARNAAGAGAAGGTWSRRCATVASDAAKEEELRARRDGRIDTLDAHLGPDDTCSSTAEPVEPGARRRAAPREVADRRG
jgi:hypothetical protein